IRVGHVTGVQTCALPIFSSGVVGKGERLSVAVGDDLLRLRGGYGLAFGVGGTKSDHGRGDQEDAGSKERSVEPRGERVGQGDVRSEERRVGKGGRGGVGG